MDLEKMNAISERLNSGEPIPATDETYLRRAWEIVSSMPFEQREHTAIGLGAIAGGNQQDPLLSDPERSAALMFRCLLLTSLIDRGAIDNFMNDKELRAKVFRAAATMPCNKNDLGEALIQRTLNECLPEDAAKMREEMAKAGFDPDHPPVIQKLIDWIKQA